MKKFKVLEDSEINDEDLTVFDKGGRMPRRYKTPDEWLGQMTYGEERMVRVGPGRTGLMTLRKGNVPNMKQNLVSDEPVEKRAKVIKPQRTPDIGASRG